MKISIALCTYNGSKYLEQQLDSLQKQTKKADEIIVCDDCSSDNTLTILEKYKNVLNIKVFINNTILGITKNFEKAISLCKGDIIFLCDQDDIWEKNKIEIMLEIFKKNNDVGLCLCNGILIDKNSKQIKDYTLWKSFKINKINKKNFNIDLLLNKYIFTGMAMAFRSSLKKYILPISENSLHDEWIGIIGTYFSKVYFIEDCLVKYRIHDNQQVGIYTVLSIKSIYKILCSYTFSNIHKELNKVNDLTNRFQELNANKNFIEKLKKKGKFYQTRTTTSKFRFFILLWQFFMWKYNLYTSGKYKTFIRDIFLKVK